MSWRLFLYCSLCCNLLILTSCASAPPTTKNAESYFKEAESLYASHNYEEAIAQWKKVKETFTSPELSTLAELKIADAYFEKESYIEAAAGYEDFRKLHPAHEKASFALYRLGLCYYKQIAGIDTDQTLVKSAAVIFQSFLEQYPSSPYAAEVQNKLDDCRLKQVQNEFYVGNFYVRTGKYTAAIKRLNEALTKFPKSPLTDEILFNLGKAYALSGEKEKGRVVLQQLVTEYPASKHIADAHKLLK
jgi:outer membrane protein assembly factor BamD